MERFQNNVWIGPPGFALRIAKSNLILYIDLLRRLGGFWSCRVEVSESPIAQRAAHFV